MTSTWTGSAILPAFAARLRERESEAYRELVDRYGRMLYNTALRITGSPSDAEDALQETLLSAYQHIEAFEERSSLKTWLTRVCINAALTRLRRNHRHREEPLEEPASEGNVIVSRDIADPRENPEQAFRGRELRRLLGHYLDKLSPALREVFVLRDMEELSGEETARILGITVSAVKTRLSRARAALRHYLAPHLSSGRIGPRQPQPQTSELFGPQLLGAQAKLGHPSEPFAAEAPL